MNQNSQNIVLINNSRTVWSTLILITSFEFFGQFTKDVYIVIQKGVDNFETEHKTC